MYVPNTSIRAFICPLCKDEVVGMGLDRHMATCRVNWSDEKLVRQILDANPELTKEQVYRLV